MNSEEFKAIIKEIRDSEKRLVVYGFVFLLIVIGYDIVKHVFHFYKF